jgi:hypothetical protein
MVPPLEMTGEGKAIFPGHHTRNGDATPSSSFRAEVSAVVTVTIRIVCERVEKSPGEMTITVLQLLISERKLVFPYTRKISRLIVAVAILGSRAIKYAATARNDGGEKGYLSGTPYLQW